MKSGILSNHTRLLTVQNGLTIHWEMFVNSYKWDTQNSLQLHRKLTNEHIYPDTNQKMRNYLAEDILNKKMLHLIKQYQSSLSDQGQYLKGVIELLENTSQLISIFRDMRPVKELSDSRLTTLQEIRDWFLCWEKYANENEQISKKIELDSSCRLNVMRIFKHVFKVSLCCVIKF
ncbi:hypothetical protein ACF0H5_012237 [Mactra antiquata]